MIQELLFFGGIFISSFFFGCLLRLMISILFRIDMTFRGMITTGIVVAVIWTAFRLIQISMIKIR